MLVVGLQGSPRIEGNTNFLLETYLSEVQKLGGRTIRIDIARKKIAPCIECGHCDRFGCCSINDDMQQMYTLLWQADLIVLATPVFFYGPTAQAKALIDRTQTLWARKYIHKIDDPGRKRRYGVLLSLGATKGQNLFDGMILTAKYFFDAVGATHTGSLTYRKIEAAGEILKHPEALEEAKKLARELALPLLSRKKILFIGRDDSSLTQIASAFARYHGGDRVEAESAGAHCDSGINPAVEEVMRSKSIDMAFRQPKSFGNISGLSPDLIVSLDRQVAPEALTGRDGGLETNQYVEQWDLPSMHGKPVAFVEELRNNIEQKILELLSRLKNGNR